MGIRKHKPTTPGRRGSSGSDFAEVTRSAPHLGEHNDRVYRELLGYSAEEVAALSAEAVI